METYDIILDSSEELQANAAGDFVAGLNDNVMIRDLILFNKGELKEFPLTGFGVVNYLNGTANKQQIQSGIKRELKADVFPEAVVDVSEWPDVIGVDKNIYTLG